MVNADSSSRRGAQFGGGAIRPDDDYGKEATGQEGTFYGGKLNISNGTNYVRRWMFDRSKPKIGCLSSITKR